MAYGVYLQDLERAIRLGDGDSIKGIYEPSAPSAKPVRLGASSLVLPCLQYSAIADETRAEVVLRALSVDGPPIPFPRILTESDAIALGIGRPLEDACHAAIDHLMGLLVDELEFAERDAYLAVSLHPDFRLHVYQMTAIRELQYVVGASLPSGFVGLD